MLKGHTKIELTDVNTGEKTVIEEDNLVTNAVQYLLAFINKINRNPSYEIFPIATNALGGLMLFNKPLAEDVNNISFPGTAELVGYADRNTNTDDTMRGSLNVAESGQTPNGYVSVWDFSTSQANGTIQSLALTSKYAGANPFLRLTNRDFEGSDHYIDNYDNMHAMAKVGDYVYLRNRSKRDIVRGYMNPYGIKVGEYWYGGQDLPTEFVTSLPSELQTDWAYYKYSSDGYIYHITKTDQSTATYTNIYGGNSTGNAVLNLTKIKYSDASFDVLETQTVTLENCYLTNVGCDRSCISGGYLFWVSYDLKKVYIINLSNFTDVQLVEIGDEENISVNLMMPTFEGGVNFQFTYKSGNNTYTKAGFIYTNGDVIKCSVNGEIINRLGSFVNDDKLAWIASSDQDYYYSRTIKYRLRAAYLGTINNLSSPVVKLPTQTMKVTYTLNDIQEA